MSSIATTTTTEFLAPGQIQPGTALKRQLQHTRYRMQIDGSDPASHVPDGYASVTCW